MCIKRGHIFHTQVQQIFEGIFKIETIHPKIGMDRIEPDQTPADAWKASLDATCNRLMSHYHSLLRAASSTLSDQDNTTTTNTTSTSGGTGTNNARSSSSNQVGTDPRAGGGLMRDADDPPPPLASNALMSGVQSKLAAENLCVASSNALDLIRTLRLSVLLMDEELIRAEEEEEALELCLLGLEAEDECNTLESKLAELRNEELKDDYLCE